MQDCDFQCAQREYGHAHVHMFVCVSINTTLYKELIKEKHRRYTGRTPQILKSAVLSLYFKQKIA